MEGIRQEGKSGNGTEVQRQRVRGVNVGGVLPVHPPVTAGGREGPTREEASVEGLCPALCPG